MNEARQLQKAFNSFKRHHPEKRADFQLLRELLGLDAKSRLMAMTLEKTEKALERDNDFEDWNLRR